MKMDQLRFPCYQWIFFGSQIIVSQLRLFLRHLIVPDSPLEGGSDLHLHQVLSKSYKLPSGVQEGPHPFLQ